MMILMKSLPPAQAFLDMARVHGRFSCSSARIVEFLIDLLFAFALLILLRLALLILLRLALLILLRLALLILLTLTLLLSSRLTPSYPRSNSHPSLPAFICPTHLTNPPSIPPQSAHSSSKLSAHSSSRLSAQHHFQSHPQTQSTWRAKLAESKSLSQSPLYLVSTLLG